MTNLLVVCDSEVIEEMARQLLASMEQEPVSYTCSDALDDVYCGSAAMMGPAGAVGEVPLYAAPQLPQPAVLSVPDEIPKLKDGMGFKYVKDGVRYSLNYANGWNQCRAAMLQAEPVSNSDELPLDYLQGHKDGLEWAAQLAEANHPQTGDWLYDDPIDLARAIRKGPDMPTVQGGNSPVTPDGWISCSEQMPSAGEQVLAYRPDAPESNDPLIKMATYVGGSAHGHGFDCYCKPTHWMPLPAAPQQEVNRG
ncbi:DUF551 domain-containing protein [Escherichia coli]|uniref:DUF551 domain-containing protein n=1 Tax=Escherichia coli TaxID=562 RepID=UPI0039925997